MASTRRLTTILAADVAGYSRLMGADEEGTHERLKGHFEQLINPKITEYHGRIVKNTGDGALVEFASVVDAVRCAAEIQRGMIDRDAEMPDECRIRFRIGVNLGDIIAEDGDIFGDGVNVAARLEALAEPGGVCISRTVRDHIRDKLAYQLDDMGEQSVKNIARPIRVYALAADAVAALPASSTLPAASTSQPLAVPRLSIAVLPFTSLSDDRDQQYFADGITEDLTTDLSNIAGMLVISCNSAFTYKGKSVTAKQVGRELGVRYVVEGSVRRSGNQVRINAQLIDAASDTHLWAERFNGDTSDLFALQDEITSRIAVALDMALIRAEAARPSVNPDALDYIFRAREASLKPRTADSFAEAIGLLERALALDPQSVEAQCQLAAWLAARVMDNLTDTATADITRAEGLAAQALSASPNSWLVHHAKGQVLRVQRRYAEAIAEYETVLEHDRNRVFALYALGQCSLYTGLIEEAIPLVERAIRLSPRDPFIGLFNFEIGRAHLLLSRTSEAVISFEKARNAGPAYPNIRAWLAAAYALNGDTESAAAELAEARMLSRGDRYSSLAKLRTITPFGLLKISALLESTFVTGLRKAGMPEG